MNEQPGCVCGWQPTPDETKKLFETIYATYGGLFITHLQESHFLPKKYSWEQYHKLLDKLDEKYHK